MNSQPARHAFEAPPQGGQGFQPPPGRQASEAPPQGGQGFQPPPGPYSIFRVQEDARRRYVADPAGAAAASVSQVADVLADVPAPLRDARAHLEQQLSQAAAGPVAEALAVDAFTGIGNVQGVAIGVSNGSFTETAPPGSPVSSSTLRILRRRTRCRPWLRKRQAYRRRPHLQTCPHGPRSSESSKPRPTASWPVRLQPASRSVTSRLRRGPSARSLRDAPHPATVGC